MLKTFLTFALFVMTLNAFACWKIVGSLAVDGETWKINNKIEHNKEYIFPMGNFIFKMLVKPDKNKKNTLVYVIQEKKGTTLTLISQGEEEGIGEDKTRDIYAKGEEGQPNSIITVKLTNI